MLNEPFTLDGIEPLRLIGTGGFGEVWLARQTKIDRQVAVKVGHTPIADETVRIRFERECIALGRLSGHPNIVDVFTAGQLDDGRPYLMLEYIDGGTLWRRLKQGPMSERELRFIGLELASALCVAHEAGVLHRDLKPENILLRKTGEAVLGDFGIARLQDGANTTSHPITASVAYAAPEILTGDDATVASDLYGLGVCLLTAGIQGVPFMKQSDDSVHPIIERVLADAPPDLREHGYSPGFADLVSSLLVKQGRHRPSSAEETRDALELLIEEEPLDDDPVEAAALGGRTPAARSRSTGGSIGRTTTGRAVAVADQPATLDEGAVDRRGEAPAGGERRGTGDRIRILGAVAGALLLTGGVVAFALLGGTGDLFESTPEADTAVVSPRPLALPLNSTDLGLGEGAQVEADSAGPNSAQFCDNTPDTGGLVGWTGKTNASAAGFPVVFQQVARFDSILAATTYVDSYLAGVDCPQWTISADSDSPIVVLPAARVTEPPAGDQGIEITFEGAEGLDLAGRVTLVRRGAEVYTLSATSVDGTDLEPFDGWLDQALVELGY